MNRSPDALDRVLADLASRADLHQPADRVPAIHRRARRAAAVRVAAAAGACTAVVAVVAVALGSGGLPFNRADTDPAVQPTKSAPFLKVGLSDAKELAAGLPDSGQGPHVVVIQITLRGRVPQHADPAGDPVTAGTDNLLGLEMDWGDHGTSGRTAGGSCAPDAKLVDVNTSYLVTNHYRRAGTYRLTYTASACAPVGTVTKTMTVTVP